MFEPFFDAADLTACVSGDSTAAELNARGAEHQAATSLCGWTLSSPWASLFSTARFTSRSFRFGSLGDNVLGLRWRLPNGQKVLDLGGRVVKNVAGFDLRALSRQQPRPLWQAPNR